MRTPKITAEIRMAAQVLAVRAFGKRRIDSKLGNIASRRGSPTLVLGSAPGSVAPSGLDDSWNIVTVNGSQARLAEWGLRDPDLTVFRTRVLEQGQHQADMQRALSGRSTRHLVAVVNTPLDSTIEAKLPSWGYGAGAITLLTTLEKRVVVREQVGWFSKELFRRDTVSTGMFAILLALRLGASAVVVSGISFSAAGHVYASSAPPMNRAHRRPDQAAITGLIKRGRPIFAADPAFAAESGMPIWGA